MAGQEMEIIVEWDEPLEFTLFGKDFRISWSILLLLIGIIIVQVLLIETLVVLFLEPSLVPFLLRGLAAEILTGRESGTAVFLEGGVPIWMTMQYSAMQDLATSFIVFPIYAFLLHHYRDRDNMIMRMVQRTQKKAEQHKEKVQKQGPVYLFFFMLIPFIVNGPLIGLMIGRLVRIRMSALITVVVAATIVPAVAWTLFYNTLFSLTEEVLPTSPGYITIGVVTIVVLIIIISSVVEAIKDRNHVKERDRKTAARSDGSKTSDERP